MADEPVTTEEETKEDEPTAADKLIEEVRAKLEKSDPAPKTAPSSQPVVDQNKAATEYRESMKKQMGWSDAQFDTYQRDKAVSQAPVVSEMSKSKVRESHKDFDQLKDAYETEYKKYTDNGVAVGTDLAEQIFWMVKGREVDAGRYKAPDSQPKKDAKGSSSTRERIAPSYNPSDPGLGGGKNEAPAEEAQLSDEERGYAKLTGVDEKSYAKMREEKKQGRREVVDKTYRVPEIDLRTAGPADRDLVALLGKHGGGRI